MGWIGWTSDQTLDTPIPLIELARKGRVAMLRAIFGGGDNAPPPAPENPPLTPQRFMAMFNREHS